MNTKAAPAAWHDLAWQAVVDKVGRTSKRIGVSFPHALTSAAACAASGLLERLLLCRDAGQASGT